MARENILVGQAPDDGLGDPLRSAMIKINNMTDELYSRGNVVYVDGGFAGVEDGSAAAPYRSIQAAINDVNALGDAGANKIYAISISAGIYVENVLIPPWVYLIGSSTGTAKIQGVTAAGNQAAGGTWQIKGITLEPLDGTTETWDFSAATASVSVVLIDTLILNPTHTFEIIGKGAGHTIVTMTNALTDVSHQFTNCRLVMDVGTLLGVDTHTAVDLAGVVPDAAGHTAFAIFSGVHISTNTILNSPAGATAASKGKLSFVGCANDGKVEFTGTGSGLRELQYTSGSIGGVLITDTPAVQPVYVENNGNRYNFAEMITTPTIINSVTAPDEAGAITVTEAAFTGLIPGEDYEVKIGFAWGISNNSTKFSMKLTGDRTTTEDFVMEGKDNNARLPWMYIFPTVITSTTFNLAIEMWLFNGTGDCTITDCNIILERKG